MCFRRINFHLFSTNQKAENGLKLNNRVCYCKNLFWFINHRFMSHKLCVIMVTHYFRNRKWKKLTNWGHSMPSFTRLSLSTSPNRIGWMKEIIFPKIQDCFYVHDQMWDFGAFSIWYTRVAKMPQNGCGRDRSLAWICIPMPKCLISKGKKKWGILASACIFMRVTYLCHSHFGPFSVRYGPYIRYGPYFSKT